MAIPDILGGDPLARGAEARKPELTDYDKAAAKIGGAFRLTVLLQKRVRELVRGARPLVSSLASDSPVDIALREVLDDKVELVTSGAHAERLIAAVERGAAAGAEEAVEEEAEAEAGDGEGEPKKKAKKKTAKK